jgi:hypothetical protein
MRKIRRTCIIRYGDTFYASIDKSKNIIWNSDVRNAISLKPHNLLKIKRLLANTDKIPLNQLITQIRVRK